MANSLEERPDPPRSLCWEERFHTLTKTQMDEWLQIRAHTGSKEIESSLVSQWIGAWLSHSISIITDIWLKKEGTLPSNWEWDTEKQEKQKKVEQFGFGKHVIHNFSPHWFYSSNIQSWLGLYSVCTLSVLCLYSVCTLSVLCVFSVHTDFSCEQTISAVFLLWVWGLLRQTSSVKTSFITVYVT